MAITIAVIVLVAVLLYVFSLMTKARNATRPEDEGKPPQAKEPRKSRRQQRIDRLIEANPMPEPRSMFDIMMEEASELGIAEIPGGDGLEMPIKLKVFHRDEAVREGCSGEVRYVVADGTDPKHATVDEVRLVCDETPQPSQPAAVSRIEPLYRKLATGRAKIELALAALGQIDEVDVTSLGQAPA